MEAVKLKSIVSEGDGWITITLQDNDKLCSVKWRLAEVEGGSLSIVATDGDSPQFYNNESKVFKEIKAFAATFHRLSNSPFFS